MEPGGYTGSLDERLLRAEAACARRGARLTDVRRDVLGFILESPEPVGAYALLDRLKDRSGRGKPPTVYRALDFLLAQGLIHRLERLNAFVGCHDEGAHAHTAQFLICKPCGKVTEMADGAIDEAVAQAACRAGFRALRATIEVEGVCAACDADAVRAEVP